MAFSNAPHQLISSKFSETKKAIQKTRKRFKGEIKKDRMPGECGWSPYKVGTFLKRDVFVIPCGAVKKMMTPLAE